MTAAQSEAWRAVHSALVLLQRHAEPLGRAEQAGRTGLLARSAAVSEEHLWASERLLVHVHTFRRLTVMSPEGVIGRYEWRELSRLIRGVTPGHTCVVDLVHTLDVHDSVLLTMLAAGGQRRYRGAPFLLCNLPKLCGLPRATGGRISRRRLGL